MKTYKCSVCGELFDNKSFRDAHQNDIRIGCTPKPTLRPRYYYFTDKHESDNFAKKLNKRARVNLWLSVRNVDGYTVYNIRK
jgi:NAD-dependent SIR2 family protein deacetylase